MNSGATLVQPKSCKDKPSRKRMWVFLLAMLWTTSAHALDPQKTIGQFVHTSWTEQQGAPGNARAIAQTTDGYLWIGTTTGLFHFDGVRFAKFEPMPGEELPSPWIRTLLATRDGSLWFVLRSGVVGRLFHGHLKVYSDSDGLVPASSLVENSDGSIIAGTAKGLERFSHGAWKDVGKDWNFPGKEARQVYYDRQGALWVLTEDRILYLPSGQNRFVDPGVHCGGSGEFAEAPDGSIWIPETGQSAHTVRRIGDSGPVTEVHVGATGVLFDRNGSMWITSYGDGLRRISHPDRVGGRQIAEFGPEAELFTEKEGLSGNVVSAHSVLEDREGNIWCATVRGLDRFRDSPFTNVPVQDPERPTFILPTSDGSLWRFSIVPIDVLRISPNGDQEVMIHAGSTAATEDVAGVVWSVSSHDIIRLEQGKFVWFHLPEGIQLRQLNGIAGDKTGGIWLFDGKEGLFRFADGTLTKIANQTEPHDAWGYLYADRRRRIWLGRYGHVTVYDEGKSQDFGTADGVPPGWIDMFYDDRSGNLWVGGDGGLSKFENGRFRLLRKESLPVQSVFGMAEDDQGQVWLATDSGILRTSTSELQRAVADPGHRVHGEVFNGLDGLPGKPRTSSPMPVVARTTAGRIWFATENGIVYVDPQKLSRNQRPPPVNIETVKIDGKQVAFTDGMSLPPNTNEIEIDYTALSISIPERVLFRYRVDGADTVWHEAGTRRQAYYNRFAPGRHTFRVVACNNDGVWNEAGATWNFSVTPAFYQTYWFLLLCAATFLTMVWLLHRLRLHQVARDFNVRMRERVEERTRIARELHDTLLQSFQGSLIQMQAATNLLSRHPERAVHTLNEAINTAEGAIAESRDAIQGLRSQAASQGDLTHRLRRAGEEMAACQQAGRNPVIFRVTVEGEPMDLNPQFQDQAFQIGRELLRNAFSHAQAGQIDVDICYEDRCCRIRVRDDGKGIEPDVLRAGGRPGHWGLVGMRERARQIGAELNFRSRTGAGTEAELTMPSGLAYQTTRQVRGFQVFRKKKEKS